MPRTSLQDLVNVIQDQKGKEQICTVRVGKDDITIPKQLISTVKCF